MPNARALRAWIRLVTAAALCTVAFLIPAQGSASDPCHFECWDSTFFPEVPNCYPGPPVDCTSCLLYCRYFEPV